MKIREQANNNKDVKVWKYLDINNREWDIRKNIKSDIYQCTYKYWLLGIEDRGQNLETIAKQLDNTKLKAIEE